VTTHISLIAFLLLLPALAIVAVIGAGVLSLLFRTRWMPSGGEPAPRG